METGNNRANNKSTWNLISGFVFTGLGTYVVYRHFFGAETIATLRLILSFAMIAYGCFKLYGYFKAE